MGDRYRDAGVNIEEARRAVDLIAQAAATTATPAVIGGVGGFGSLFRFDPSTHPDPVLVASTDGVGTKLKVAIELGRYDSIGIDLVHHCINDIAVQGADPLFFLDYLAVGRLHATVAAEIVTGIANACAASGVALVGGETAELPDLYHGDDFDLAGFIVGVVARADVIDGAGVRAGDVLLGLPSSGLHTNGYSLARRVFSEDDWARSAPGLQRTIGEELLEPHRSYLDEIRILRRALRAAGGDALAFAHITGGGWVDNIPRTLPSELGVEVELGIVAGAAHLQPDPGARRCRRRRDGAHLQPRDRPHLRRAARAGAGRPGGPARGPPGGHRRPRRPRVGPRLVRLADATRRPRLRPRLEPRGGARRRR